MYTILFLRSIGDQRQHQRIECSSAIDADRIYKMLRDDSRVLDLSMWQGNTRMV